MTGLVNTEEEEEHRPECRKGWLQPAHLASPILFFSSKQWVGLQKFLKGSSIPSLPCELVNCLSLEVLKRGLSGLIY